MLLTFLYARRELTMPFFRECDFKARAVKHAFHNIVLLLNKVGSLLSPTSPLGRVTNLGWHNSI